VTRVAIKEARSREISDQMAQSDRLKVKFPSSIYEIGLRLLDGHLALCSVQLLTLLTILTTFLISIAYQPYPVSYFAAPLLITCR